MKKKLHELWIEIKFQFTIHFKNVKKYFQKNFWNWVTLGLLTLIKKVREKQKKVSEDNLSSKEIIKE